MISQKSKNGKLNVPTLEKLNTACKKWLDEAMVPSIKESHVDVEAAAKAAADREAALATMEEPAEEAAVVDLAQKAGTSLTAPAAAARATAEQEAVVAEVVTSSTEAPPLQPLPHSAQDVCALLKALSIRAFELLVIDQDRPHLKSTVQVMVAESEVMETILTIGPAKLTGRGVRHEVEKNLKLPRDALKCHCGAISEMIDDLLWNLPVDLAPAFNETRLDRAWEPEWEWEPESSVGEQQAKLASRAEEERASAMQRVQAEERANAMVRRELGLNAWQGILTSLFQTLRLLLSKPHQAAALIAEEEEALSKQLMTVGSNRAGKKGQKKRMKTNSLRPPPPPLSPSALPPAPFARGASVDGPMHLLDSPYVAPSSLGEAPDSDASPDSGPVTTDSYDKTSHSGVPDSMPHGTLCAAATVLPADDTVEDGSDVCDICFEGPKSHAFVPCGHQCVCGPCSAKVVEGNPCNTCPICRQPCMMAMAIFKT